jgi:tetratricopeptide (TPR) repeat protein
MNRVYITLIGLVTLAVLSATTTMRGQCSGERAATQQSTAGPPASADSVATQPQFYDEPHFTVAGVTDTTTMGGHGSSPIIIRNTESLVRATAALTEESGSKPPSASNTARTEASLRQAVQQRPDSFEANSQLGKWLVDEERPAEGIAYLERAAGINPNDFENLYELALAYFKMANYASAKTEAGPLLNIAADNKEKGRAHHLLGQIDEKLGDPLEAVREFQRAAESNPTEPNLFDWGSELLLHRAAEPAIEVFTKGNRLFPQSVRMLTALGAAWYVQGTHEKAAQRLCQASDLNPEDPNPYLFMGKMQATEAMPAEAIAPRLERFAKLQPENALANYYYAVSLWKARKFVADAATLAQIESLLTRSVQLDPRQGEADLQLGIVYAEQKQTAKAISAYDRAITATPDLAEAHYRLAQAYRLTEQPAKAQAELQLYEKISKANADETETQRRQTQQFVYQLQQTKSAVQPE